MKEERSDKVAVLGLGIIGSRVADRIGSMGWRLATWSRTPKGRGDEAASCADAVCHADAISLFLKDGPAVREVMSAIGTHLKPGQVVMNHSTVDLETTQWLDHFCAARSCGFLDAPFTGSKMAAGNGELVYYVSGEAAMKSRMDDLLAASSRLRMDCGEIGHATVIKLATNLMSACAVQAMAEAFALVSRHGVADKDLVNAVSANANASPLAAMKMQAMMMRDYDTHFSLSNMAKDARYALALSKGMELPAIEAVGKRMDELVAQGLGDMDYSVLGKPYLERA